MIAADTFKALGDPVRLKIVERLASGAYLSIGEITEGLGLTRQGVRKPLHVLSEARLVKLERQGRSTKITLDAAALKAANEFISKLEHNWDNRLEALRESVEKSNSERSATS